MTELPDDDLRALVERALALADAQGLSSVGINLDQARVALGGKDDNEQMSAEEMERRFDAA